MYRTSDTRAPEEAGWVGVTATVSWPSGLVTLSSLSPFIFVQKLRLNSG